MPDSPDDSRPDVNIRAVMGLLARPMRGSGRHFSHNVRNPPQQRCPLANGEFARTPHVRGQFLSTQRAPCSALLAPFYPCFIRKLDEQNTKSDQQERAYAHAPDRHIQDLHGHLPRGQLLCGRIRGLLL
jgi:hypothetical protein